MISWSLKVYVCFAKHLHKCIFVSKGRCRKNWGQRTQRRAGKWHLQFQVLRNGNKNLHGFDFHLHQWNYTQVFQFVILRYRGKKVILHMWQHGFLALKHRNSGNSINMAGAFHCRGIQGFREAGVFKGSGVAWEILALLDQSGERASLVLPDSWRMRISW